MGLFGGIIAGAMQGAGQGISDVAAEQTKAADQQTLAQVQEQAALDKAQRIAEYQANLQNQQQATAAGRVSDAAQPYLQQSTVANYLQANPDTVMAAADVPTGADGYVSDDAPTRPIAYSDLSLEDLASYAPTAKQQLAAKARAAVDTGDAGQGGAEKLLALDANTDLAGQRIESKLAMNQLTNQTNLDKVQAQWQGKLDSALYAFQLKGANATDPSEKYDAKRMEERGRIIASDLSSTDKMIAGIRVQEAMSPTPKGEAQLDYYNQQREDLIAKSKQLYEEAGSPRVSTAQQPQGNRNSPSGLPAALGGTNFSSAFQPQGAPAQAPQAANSADIAAKLLNVPRPAPAAPQPAPAAAPSGALTAPAAPASASAPAAQVAATRQDLSARLAQLSAEAQQLFNANDAPSRMRLSSIMQQADAVKRQLSALPGLVSSSAGISPPVGSVWFPE